MDWLSILKNALALVVLIGNMINDAQQRGLGRIEATNEALLKAQQDVSFGNAIEEDAAREHAKHPDTDAGFDSSFERQAP